MKKLTSLFLALVMILSLAACGGSRSGMQKLADALQANGDLIDNDFYAFSDITKSGTNTVLSAIYHTPGSNEVNFLFTFEVESGAEVMLAFDYLLDKEAPSTVRFNMTSSSGSKLSSGTASIDLATYTKDTLLNFSSNSDTNELANDGLALAFPLWAELLDDGADMTMADIGFTSYKE